MTQRNRVVIERGKTRVFASAVDWPGWARSGKTEEAALEALRETTARYDRVASLAGIGGVIAAAKNLNVIEQLPGSTTTDFGAPDVVASCERESMTDAECGRMIALLQACWDYFDDVTGRVSEELRKGPRGGGRNRTGLVAHTLEAERSYVRQIGVKTPKGALDDEEGRRAHREAVSEAIRAINSGTGTEPKWPVRYFIRRCAWHVLDHAWEMEDKDLTGAAPEQSRP